MIAQAGVSLNEMAAQLKKTFNVIRDEMCKYLLTPRVGDQNRPVS